MKSAGGKSEEEEEEMGRGGHFPNDGVAAAAAAAAASKAAIPLPYGGGERDLSSTWSKDSGALPTEAALRESKAAPDLGAGFG